MHICYLDESGTVEPATSTTHFVLLGFSISAATWRERDAEANSIKGRYDLLGKEIHTAWILREYPGFAATNNSQLTSMVQIADLCTYATRRFFEKGDAPLFDKIYPRFDRNRGVLVGLRHYTGAQVCTCRVCLDHGRYR